MSKNVVGAFQASCHDMLQYSRPNDIIVTEFEFQILTMEAGL